MISLYPIFISIRTLFNIINQSEEKAALVGCSSSLDVGVLCEVEGQLVPALSELLDCGVLGDHCWVGGREGVEGFGFAEHFPLVMEVLGDLLEGAVVVEAEDILLGGEGVQEVEQTHLDFGHSRRLE